MTRYARPSPSGQSWAWAPGFLISRIFLLGLSDALLAADEMIKACLLFHLLSPIEAGS